ncbi:hypothetical protein LCGC14_2871630 [marine sediment metagenome]|uniref:Uncharacterized protein n=1 Tax=marine sediment metagenome TaxID=412755 RepID=A0A0F8Y308_9ZZZZ
MLDNMSILLLTGPRAVHSPRCPVRPMSIPMVGAGRGGGDDPMDLEALRHEDPILRVLRAAQELRMADMMEAAVA